MGKGSITMRLMEFITDRDGSLSHTKLWSNIGLATITFTYIHHVVKNGLSPELMVAYGGIVVFGRVASKYIDSKGESNVSISN